MRVALVLLALVLGAELSAQTALPAQTAQPYSETEFDPLALKIRRAEIIAVGAIPLAYLFAGIGYDYYYYASTGFPQDNIPWPVGPGTSGWTSTSQPEALQRKNLTLVGTALAVGVLLAAADWWLGE